MSDNAAPDRRDSGPVQSLNLERELHEEREQSQQARERADELQEEVDRLKAEVLRYRGAAIAANQRAERTKRTLSFQLGNALVMAGKSLGGLKKLPLKLLDLRRQSKAGRFGAGVRATTDAGEEQLSSFELVDEVEKLYQLDGAEAARMFLERVAEQVNPRDLATAYTRLARSHFQLDPNAACEFGERALEMDERPFRRKWLAFLKFDAGRITEAYQLLGSLPKDELLSESERFKAERIRGSQRLLSDGLMLAVSAPRRAPERGPLLYIAASALPYHVSGYTTRTHSLLCALRAAKQDVICVSRPGYPQDRTDSLRAVSSQVQVIDGVHYETLPGPHRRKLAPDDYFAEAGRLLAERARFLGARAIHAASNYENAIPALLAARQLGLPFTYEVRGLWEYTTASRAPGWEETEGFALDRKLETLVATEADAVVTLNNALRDELVARGVSREQISLAPNAIDPEQFVPGSKDQDLAKQLGLSEGDFVVGYLGSIVGYEGLDDLITAFARLSQELPNARLLIVGGGSSLDLLKQQAADAGIAERAIFTDRVAPDQVQRYYTLFDVVALPRKPYRVCELVSPLKPLEVMAMEIPIVVSSVTALQEMVEDGVTGLVFPAAQPEALADQLKKLAGSSQLRQTLGKAARQHVIEHSTWQNVAKEIARVHAETRSLLSPSA